MKQLFIAGNWKSNKTIHEAKEWLDAFRSASAAVSFEHMTVVVCASYTALTGLKDSLAQKPCSVTLGAQNVSGFSEGAYTGEVTAKMVKEVADWVIIGHSERRKYFGEDDTQLLHKVELGKAAGLKIIYCVQDDTTPVPPGVDVIAYEPVWAIGTGKTDTPENANAVVTTIKSKTGVPIVIYGGSVTDANVASFVNTPAIDGVLPGGASLDPIKFSSLVSSARVG